MPKLQRTTKPNNGFFIYDNGKSVLIRQPNIIDVAKLYEAIMANIKTVRAIFNKPHEFSE